MLDLNQLRDEILRKTHDVLGQVIKEELEEVEKVTSFDVEGEFEDDRVYAVLGNDLNKAKKLLVENTRLWDKIQRAAKRKSLDSPLSQRPS